MMTLLPVPRTVQAACRRSACRESCSQLARVNAVILVMTPFLLVLHGILAFRERNRERL
jgi:hypothetical protein